jgi:hypothetical protein
LLSMICKPEAVVMGFPAVWAVAVAWMATGVAIAAAAAAIRVLMMVRREERIADTLFARDGRL